ncbi:hypothetical protein [Mesorhizobium wenxiniae]|nr:hypothetical protein [Mesorhizobium wenxiniae]
MAATNTPTARAIRYLSGIGVHFTGRPHLYGKRALERVDHAFAQTGRRAMPFRGIADAEQLATLTRILDDYCEQAGIEGSHPAREHLARRLIALFSGGIDSPDDIKMALDSISKGFQTDLRAM